MTEGIPNGLSLPNGTYTRLEGRDHAAPAEMVAPVVTELLTAAATTLDV